MEKKLGIGSRVIHPAFGDGVIIKIHKAAYDVVFTKFGAKQVALNYEKWEIVEKVETQEEVSFSELEKSFLRTLRHFSDITEVVELGDKWSDGVLIFQPKDASLKPKEIPIETFFHKIVMLRDRLRVMEQRINSSKNLSDEEKINLQQYITRIYGSLTTFNILFARKQDHFVGEKLSK